MSPYADFLRSSHTYEVLARLGWMVKGILFSLIGFLALRGAAGRPDEDADPEGVFALIGDEPYGQALLWGIAAGLLFYGLWRLAVGIFDMEEKGTNWMGLARRAGFIGVGAFYLFLSAWLGSALAVGDTRPDGEDYTTWAAQIMELPAGPIFIAIAGFITAFAGLFQIYRAYTAPYEDHWDHERMTGISRWFGRWFARFGVAGRGGAFIAMAYFIVRSAFEERPEEARDLGETFSALAEEPALLAILGIGFAAYGLHCFLNARYRTIGD